MLILKDLRSAYLDYRHKVIGKTTYNQAIFYRNSINHVLLEYRSMSPRRPAPRAERINAGCYVQSGRTSYELG